MFLLNKLFEVGIKKFITTDVDKDLVNSVYKYTNLCTSSKTVVTF